MAALCITTCLQAIKSSSKKKLISFIKSLDAVDHTQYFGAKHLDLKFIYADSKNSYLPRLEAKHYATLTQILSKSPNLHTLCYNLDGRIYIWKTAFSKGSGENSYTGTGGHLFEWR